MNYKELYIVGIGASAGDLKLYKSFYQKFKWMIIYLML